MSKLDAVTAPTDISGVPDKFPAVPDILPVKLPTKLVAVNVAFVASNVKLGLV